MMNQTAQCHLEALRQSLKAVDAVVGNGRRVLDDVAAGGTQERHLQVVQRVIATGFEEEEGQ
jgi:hypothetical protein